MSKVHITFNEDQEFFHIVSKNSNEPVLQGYLYDVITKRGWFVACDGHCGMNAIVIAPKDMKNTIESLFSV